jgi:hypothetical protein
MLNNMQLAGLVGLAAMMRTAYEAERARPHPGLTEEEMLWVQRFLSFSPQAQEKALTYLENLQRYLEERE